MHTGAVNSMKVLVVMLVPFFVGVGATRHVGFHSCPANVKIAGKEVGAKCFVQGDGTSKTNTVVRGPCGIFCKVTYNCKEKCTGTSSAWFNPDCPGCYFDASAANRLYSMQCCAYPQGGSPDLEAGTKCTTTESSNNPHGSWTATMDLNDYKAECNAVNAAGYSVFLRRLEVYMELKWFWFIPTATEVAADNGPQGDITERLLDIASRWAVAKRARKVANWEEARASLRSSELNISRNAAEESVVKRLEMLQPGETDFILGVTLKR